MKCKKHSLAIAIAAALAGLATLGLAVAHPDVTASAGSAAPGTYQIFCLTTANKALPCQSGATANSYETPVNTAVILDAHVADQSGHLATSGLLIFQDCLLKRVPGPSSACDSGSGLWSNFQEVRIRVGPGVPPEDILVAYGIVSSPQTIGFRFRYLGGGSGIANGISDSIDVTWF